ncbi:MAG: AlkA N-terminal domain-containing protein [Halioglobus sp.]
MPSPQPQTDTNPLNSEHCRLARLSRDSRFDGEFFLAVKTTGIYCRPICPARPPAEKNVHYYRHAAQAAEAGYRPCLRCRPESAPGSPAWRGSSTTVQRALSLIAAGALNEASIDNLAERLGVGERYLRKLFQREVGISPLAVAQNQRLLFAKKLLVETELPMTTVAYAAGFSSVRRFNSAVRGSYDTTPGDLRRRQGKAHSDGDITLQLQYRPPYDWEGVIDFFQRHALDGIEQVAPDSYQRSLRVHGGTGRIRVSHQKNRNALLLQLALPDPGQLMSVVATVRRMFDLDANPQVIHQCLARDPVLKTLSERFPGIRAPSQPSLYEATVRAIVGQQVSIQAARRVCSRLAAATSQGPMTDSEPILFPAPGDIAQLDDEYFAMPTRRRDTLRAACQLSHQHAGHPHLEALSQLKGIGPWTTAMVAMRGFGDPDIFPAGDLGLVKAYAAIAKNITLTKDHPEQWRPWRSYAANLLWRSLSA